MNPFVTLANTVQIVSLIAIAETTEVLVSPNQVIEHFCLDQSAKTLLAVQTFSLFLSLILSPFFPGRCVCQQGFTGPRCDRPCPKGFYGVGCKQACLPCTSGKKELQMSLRDIP